MNVIIAWLRLDLRRRRRSLAALALLIVNLLAAWPGHRAARLSGHDHVLRTE